MLCVESVRLVTDPMWGTCTRIGQADPSPHLKSSKYLVAKKRLPGDWWKAVDWKAPGTTIYHPNSSLASLDSEYELSSQSVFLVVAIRINLCVAMDRLTDLPTNHLTAWG